jgi:hypothetical protein
LLGLKKERELFNLLDFFPIFMRMEQGYGILGIRGAKDGQTAVILKKTIKEKTSNSASQRLSYSKETFKLGQ